MAAQFYESEPRLATGLSLLNLFGLSSTTAKVCGGFIAVLIIAYFVLHFRYPCRSSSSLTQVVGQATALFKECLATHAFHVGEYDRFRRTLNQVTARASEIASRTHCLDETNASGENSSLHDYSNKMSFLCKRLKDVVKCHRDARVLLRNLEVCLMRASHSQAQFQLLQRATVPASP
ncbi:hypothetical protein E1B28_006913 [Marasmius oreades]|uniref:Uncharacterized protein n=1 Tax=Marasmius oreades TaxID=181124 RepID=A0A9P7USW6_9AGAR|nr:uncharacterized protein E1B28_006913 [Marasmius oreades]KAG7093227.1 hypothetical protein E1B28_006913 [Marasmius oreades]